IAMSRRFGMVRKQGPPPPPRRTMGSLGGDRGDGAYGAPGLASRTRAIHLMVYDCDNAANGGDTALPQAPWMEVTPCGQPLALCGDAATDAFRLGTAMSSPREAGPIPATQQCGSKPGAAHPREPSLGRASG